MSEPAAETPAVETPAAPIDRRRYRRVRWFFAKVFLNVLWHDFVLDLPLLSVLRGEPLPRWRRLARRYRALAVELGGVLIKLGQYLSTRVDVLPLEVARELAGLQDEVPAEPYAAIAAQIAADFGRPVEEVFASVDPEPLGAASLAQVHAAVLPDGRPVVVKVLRPGIEVLVETDLAAIGLALRWLKGWRFVRRRVDLDWLMEEFTTTTRLELDLEAEGRHAERFAADFADDPEVHVPEVYWEFTARSTLTEENVAFLKVADLEALDAAGIDRVELAKKLYRVYMRQIFVHNFVHADPHPGNLFVRPLAGPGDDPGFRAEPGEGVPPGRGRPFQVVFVDFGMVAVVPERLRAALRQLVVGLALRDAARVVQACSDAGILLPGADLQQLEEAVDSVFRRFWGQEIGRLNQMVKSEAAALWREFGRLLLETPVQAQADLLFTGRAVELLSGLATRLDPAFNPWNEMVPFAEGLAADALDGDWGERLRGAADQARLLIGLPGTAADVLQQAQRGRLAVRSALAPEARRQVERLERSVDRLGSILFPAAMLVAGAVLYESTPTVGVGLMLAAGALYAASVLWRWLG